MKNLKIILGESIPVILGFFLFLMANFNKSFSYLNIKLGSFPFFVTEIMLGLLMIGCFFSMKTSCSAIFSNKSDKIFIGALSVFFLFFLIGMRHAFDGISSPVQSIKRSAIVYYSLFAIFSFLFFKGNEKVKVVMYWIVWGGAIASISYVIRISGSIVYFPKNVPIASGFSMVLSVAFGIYLYSKSKNLWGALLPSIISCIGLLFCDVRSVRLAIIFVAIIFSFSLFTRISKKILIPIGLVGAFIFMLSLIKTPFLNYARQVNTEKLNAYQEELFNASRPISNKKVSEIDPVAPTPSVPSNKPVEIGPIVSPPSNPLPIDKPSPQSLVDKEFEFLSHRVPLVFSEFLRKKIYSLTQKQESSGGNTFWRITVWLELIEKAIYENLFFGVGFSRPIVILDVSPYQSLELIKKAMVIFSKKNDFSERLSDKNRNIIDDVQYPLPFSSDKNDPMGIVSTYWFDMEPHNSFVHLFYRSGLIGIILFFIAFGSVFLRGAFLFFRGKHSVLPLNLFMLFFLVIASLNVTLENPFIGAFFWIVLGLINVLFGFEENEINIFG
ncbi:MAG: hypothetical protein ACKVQC_09970 [Elusimicrobiota bacterium]